MSDTMSVDLQDVQSRAGASDLDRTAWLLERSQGITATEVRDLYLRRISVAGLIAKKLAGPEPELTGNYVVWGKTREPVIAATIESIYPTLLPESRVFHAADNSRFLGSPDGLGVVHGQVVVSEIKTSKYEIPLGSQAEAKKGYRAQMTWVMRVTGARRCLYAWEVHDDTFLERENGAWEPEPVGLVPVMEWLEYDEALAKELEAIAVGFLVAFDAATAGDVVQYDDELDTLAVNLLRFREEESSAKKAKEQTWKELQVKLRSEHDELSQESPLARITWRAAGTADVAGDPVSEVDEASLVADHPVMAQEYVEALRACDEALERRDRAAQAWRALAEKYTTTVPGEVRQVPVKESLTVTAVKNKEMKA
jgi:hypothetical protein